MTIEVHDGPIGTKGIEPALGSATGTAGGVTGTPGPYVSGGAENPDAGPNVFYDGILFKDPLYRFNMGGVALTAGGYKNQMLGFVEHQLLTADFLPSTIATANIAALAAPASGVALTLVAASGAGITLNAAAVTVLNSSLTVPAGGVYIDALPAWQGFGSSGAVQGWSGAAVGRAVSLTSGSNLSAINFTFRGYDLYGRPQTETFAGPNNNTVNGKKGWKWLVSVTPNGTNAGTVSVGTADIFEFPIRADRFSQVEIWYNETAISANTGFVAADATSPGTATTGSPRGTYAVQSASDGVKRLVVTQRMSPANMNTSPPALGMFGVTPF